MHKSKNAFADGDGVPRENIETGDAAISAHRLGIEAQDLLLVANASLHRDLFRIGDLRITAGHADRGQQVDTTEIRKIERASLLHLAEYCEALLGKFSDRDINLRIDEISLH